MSGVVYKIECNISGLVYYGSTIHFNKRMNQHKNLHASCKSKKPCTSSKIILNGDYRIEILEHYENATKLLLETRERFYIENNKCVNRQCPLRTRQEKYVCICGKELSSITGRSRHIKSKQHKDFIEHDIEYKKPCKTYEERKYDKIDCVCGGKYIHSHQSTHNKTNKHQQYIKSIII